MEIEHVIGLGSFRGAACALPDGRYVGAAGGCLIIGSVSDPHAQVFLRASDDPVCALKVSRSGRFIVSAHTGTNADVVVWDAESHEAVITVGDHANAVLDCDVSDDDTILVSLGADRRLLFHDMSNGGIITHTPLAAVVPEGVAALVTAGPRAQDAKRRVTGRFHVAVVAGGTLHLLLLDPFSGTVEPLFAAHQMRALLGSFQRVFTVGAYTTSGDLFFLGAESGEVAVISTETGCLVHTIRACKLGARGLALVCTGDDVPAEGGADGGNGGGFRYANFGPGSQRSTTVLVAGGDGTIVSLHMPNHQTPTAVNVVARTSVDDVPASLSVLKADDGACPQVLVGCSSGSLHVVDVRHTAAVQPEYERGRSNAFGRQAAATTPALPPANAVRIADSSRAAMNIVTPHPSDAAVVLTASQDGLLRAWDLNSYLCPYTLEADTTAAKAKGSLVCSAMRVADALGIVVTAWSDGAVRCHDLTTQKLLWTHARAHRCAVTALCLSPDLKFFITGASDGEVKVWDTRTRELRSETKAHAQAVTTLTLFDDPRYLLSASTDRTVCTWDIGPTGAQLRRATLHATHAGPLTACHLSRTQQHFYSSSVDGKLHHCDLRMPKEPVAIADYHAPCADPTAVVPALSSSGHPTCMAFGADERLVAVGGSDAIVKMWDLSRSFSAPVAVGGGHSGAVSSIAFTADQKQVVSVATDATLCIWNCYL